MGLARSLEHWEKHSISVEAISSRFTWLKPNDMLKSNFTWVEKYNLILLSSTAKPHDRRCVGHVKCTLLPSITVSANNLIFPKPCSVEVISCSHHSCSFRFCCWCIACLYCLGASHIYIVNFSCFLHPHSFLSSSFLPVSPPPLSCTVAFHCTCHTECHWLAPLLHQIRYLQKTPLVL